MSRTRHAVYTSLPDVVLRSENIMGKMYLNTENSLDVDWRGCESVTCEARRF